jgi:alpha-D-xyloside xylohydrolase
MIKNRKFVIVPVSKNKPQAFDYEAKGKEVTYDGQQQIIQLK